MPKDKKSKEKKEGTSKSTEVELVKRKNSIVDSSSGSSTSSSDNSGNTSDHSASGDSDGSVGFDNEKGTMTSDDALESSSGINGGTHCSVDIRDRTEEMRRLMNENTNNKPVRVVDQMNGVPISDRTHLVPISNGLQDTEEGQSTSSGASGQKDSLQTSKATGKLSKDNKKHKQAKQLTKKQKKELERKEYERQLGGVAPSYPGQKVPPRPPLEYVVEQENNLHVHHFNEWSGDAVQDGEMIVRGTNAAAKSMLGEKPVVMPFLRKEEDLGPSMHYTDLHKNSQIRYLRNINSIGAYTGLPAAVKPLHRMGYGIAASGIPDSQPVMLTINGAKPFMKHQYSDYIMSGSKITNWRSDFVSSVDMDRASQDAGYVEVMQHLQKSINEMISNSNDPFIKKTAIAMRDTDLRQVLLHFGEIERIISRREQQMRNMGMGVTNHLPRYDDLARPSRLNYLVTQTLKWCVNMFLEKFDDDCVETRALSILMYLASTCPGEKPCYEDKHRKCSMLYFMLHTSSEKETHMAYKFTGGNTLLHFAAMSGAPCQIDALLRCNAPLNELNDQYKSPIALALRRHSTLIARQLMWHGADLGGALTLSHIQPRTRRQAMNKELSEWQDYCAKSIPYKAREFMSQRLRALNNTFVSWVEALLVDAEARINLGVHSVKSSLHQIRIGRDITDGLVTVEGRSFVKCFQKNFQMAIEKSEFEKEPVVLFLIPCHYTHFDTTMPANFPHIVRVPMITDAMAVANRIARKETERIANGECRVEYSNELKHLRPIRLLGDSVSISFGDGAVDRNEVLESFFSYEHNGVIYGYNLPASVTKTNANLVHINVTIVIPESEVDRFQNCFFMVQAVQVVVREPPKTLSDSAGFANMNDKSMDPRAEKIAQQVAVRKAEMIAAEALRHREEELRDIRVRGMVADIQSTVAQRKKDKESGATSSNPLLKEEEPTISVELPKPRFQPASALIPPFPSRQNDSPCCSSSNAKFPKTKTE